MLGWGIEIAGRCGVPWVSTDFSALFHPDNNFHDANAFTDLTDFADRTAHLTGPGLRQPGDAPFPYPPAAAFLFRFFNHAFAEPEAAYLWSFALCALAATCMVSWRIGPRRPLAQAVLWVTALLGSSQIFCANRGNLEWMHSAAAAAGLALFLGGAGWAAAVIIGLAMSIKPFSALLLLLFVWRRAWMQGALACMVCLFVSGVSLHFLGPSVPEVWRALSACWADYYHQQVVTLNILQVLKTDHSLMDTVRILLWRFGLHGGAPPQMELVAGSGVPLMLRLDLWAKVFQEVAIAAVLWALVRFRRMPALSQVFALVLLMLLLPYASSEYTLMLLYLPAAVLLVRGEVRWDMAVMLALVFAPLNVFGVFAGALKAALLVGILCRVVVRPVGLTERGEFVPAG
jgi:hypothetical protein